MAGAVPDPDAPAPLLDPGAAPDRHSEAARDVTEPPGCVAIDVSEELAALPCDESAKTKRGRARTGPMWMGFS